MLKGSGGDQLAQDNSYSDMQKLYKTCVLYPLNHERLRKHKPKTHFYVAFACKILFAYSSSPSSRRSIVASHSADSVSHVTPTTLTHRLTHVLISHLQSEREELHLNVRGALLVKGWGHNNDVLICYMDFVWSRSQTQRLLA